MERFPGYMKVYVKVILKCEYYNIVEILLQAPAFGRQAALQSSIGTSGRVSPLPGIG
jgi:hypothetical protein